MKLIADPDERSLASTLRELLAKKCPPSLAREPAAQRMPQSLWKALCDTGVLGLGVPLEYGGSGGTLADLGVFCIEAGRALCPTLVHSTVAGTLAINALGIPAQRERWLPALTSGALRATTALWHPRNAAIVTPTLRAEPAGDGWLLRGAADFVADADVADVIVATATEVSSQKILCFVVPLDGLRIEPLSIMGGHRLFRVEFGDVVVPDSMDVRVDDLRRVANAAVTLLSLDLVGIGEAVLERTVDYTTMRHQFGRPIASFQAAQHLVANMHIALAAARLAARSAAFWIGRGHIAVRETAVARMQSAAAAKLITLDAHQLHGGMGYVTETDLHLWSERARVLSTLGGGADVAAGWLQEEMELGCSATV
ncbi:MAG TPA: acyl-CoA dehydrogenase family protein [Mycobacterium sp.]|jgi:alkylation response protein AidB-like acyl-CoA dehydrogenase